MIEHELVARRDLVEPGQGDRGVDSEMDRVPRLIAHVTAHDDDRADDDRDQEHGSDRGGDHARVDAAGEHLRDLLRQRQPVERRIAPDREDDVRQHEIETRMPVPAMPDGEPVEAHRPLDPRDPREQQHLQQGRERTQQTGDPRDADEEVARALDCVTLPPFHHSQMINATFAATTPNASQSGIVRRSPPYGHRHGPPGDARRYGLTHRRRS